MKDQSLVHPFFGSILINTILRGFIIAKLQKKKRLLKKTQEKKSQWIYAISHNPFLKNPNPKLG